ncbi:MAG: associated Golgi protein [Verrucomicrobiaceae bacterium]|nr:associated Golgi protein [Verrucomicrobiaceae bacterium]
MDAESTALRGEVPPFVMPEKPTLSPAKKGLIAGLALAIVAIFVFGHPKEWLEEIASYVDNLGPWGPVVFAIAFIVASLLMVPGSVLTLSAGALFGVVRGVVLVSISSTIAATVVFWFSRFVARDYVARRVEGNAAFTALDRALEKEGWKVVALSRLCPVLPYAPLNYAFGVTKVKPGPYVAASWLGSLPATIVYVYLGSIARTGLSGQGQSPLAWTLYGLGLVAAVTAVYYITQFSRKALKSAGVEAQK